MRIDRRRIAISLAGFCVFLDLYAPQSVLPLLAQEWGTTPADTGLTVSATTLAVALVAPFAGTAADVLGRKRVIAAAMMALTVPMALAATAADLSQLVLWRFLEGLLLPPVFTVTIAYIGEEFPPAEAAAVAGIYLSASVLGGFSSRFLTGVLSDRLGWRPAFLALAAITFCCALGVLLLMPRERGFRRSANLLASARQMLRHLRKPELVAIDAFGFGVLFNFVALFSYASFLLAAPPFSLSPAGLGTIFAVYLVGMVVTPFTGQGLAYFGRRKFTTGLLVIWAGGALLTLAPSLAAVIAGLAVCAACGFLCQAIATGFVAVAGGEGRSSAVGLYAAFYYAGGSAGGVLPGFAWSAAGWSGCVALVAAMLAAMALLVRCAWSEPAPAR